MKFVSCEEAFDFKHTNTLTVHLSPEPFLVEDEVAQHLTQVFGDKITVSDEVAAPEAPTEAPLLEEEPTEEQPADKSEDDLLVEDEEAESESEPKVKKARAKKE